MARFDYHQEVAPLENVLGTCKAAGADGWELCGCVQVAIAPAGPGGLITGPEGLQPRPGALLLFKRPAPALVVAAGQLPPAGAMAN